jgi:hypothetical protein
VPRFSIRRKKDPQKLNVIFLDQNCRNFTPQKFYIDGDTKRYLKELIQKIKYF